MKIAVIFTSGDDLKQHYKNDWIGRDINDSASSVMRALKGLGHDVAHYHADIELFEKLRKEKNNIDMVFNLCDDGFFSNPELEPHIPAMFDILNIPYTGGDYLTLALTLRKDTAKNLLMFESLPTPNFQVFQNGTQMHNKDMKFPLFVKPSREDASIGINYESVVRNEEELKKRVEHVINEYRQPALVEEFIEGREFNVGIIGNNDVLPVSEINFDQLPHDKPKIVNYDAKWNKDSPDYKGTVRNCPAEIDKKLEKKLAELAVQAGRVFGCRDYFRVDFRVDKKNRPFILEVNQNPDISEDAGLFAMAKSKGYSYKDLISKIITSAAARINK